MREPRMQPFPGGLTRRRLVNLGESLTAARSRFWLCAGLMATRQAGLKD